MEAVAPPPPLHVRTAQIAEDARSGEFRRHWGVLLGSALGLVVGLPEILPYVGGVFMPWVLKDFGWSRSEFAVGSTLGGLVAAFSAPAAGFIADRFGARIPTAIGLAGFILMLLALSRLGPHVQVYWAIMACGGVAGLLCGPLVFTRALSLAFARNRGLAIGLCMSAIGVGGAVYPLVLTKIILVSGWRAAYFALAVWVLAAAPVVLFLIGGKRAPRAAPRERPIRERVDWRLVFAAPAYWRLLISFIFAASAITGYNLHLVTMLRQAGVPPLQAAAMQSLVGLTLLTSRLLAGGLVDRLFAPWVAAALMVGAAIGVAGLAMFGAVVALPAVILIGLAWGSEVDLMGYMTSRYFDLKVYGRAYGAIYGVATLAAASSALWIGLVADHFGRYQPALWISTVLALIAAALFATAPPFPQPLREATIEQDGL